MSKWIKHITHPGGDVKFLFEWWKMFHSWAQRSFLHAKSAGKGLWEFVRRHLGSASDWFAGGEKFFACCNFIRFKFFFIFRSINSILIHKLNYKEHNEKRKNMYKLNSCLVFFLSFCRREDTTKDKYHYSLTWTCEFPNEKDTYYFAHCYPYTYSDLQVCSFCLSSLLCYHFFTLECPSLLIIMRNFGKDELFRVKSWVKTIPNLSNLTYRTSYMKEGRKRKVKNYVLLISFVSSVWPKIQFTSWSGRKYE